VFLCRFDAGSDMSNDVSSTVAGWPAFRSNYVNYVDDFRSI